MKKLLFILLLPITVFAQDPSQYHPDDLITVPARDVFWYDAPEIHIFGIQYWKDFAYHNGLYAFQQWDRAENLEKALNMCIDGANQEAACDSQAIPFKGAGDGSLWKPDADPKASCAGRAAFLLPSSVVGRVSNNAEILDSNFNVLDTAYFKGNTNPNRPTFCTRNKRGSQFGSGPVYIRYTVGGGGLTPNGRTECKKVQNPSQREE